MDGSSRLLHATCIAADGVAALLLGPSGSGKSDLALRCLMMRGWDGDREMRPSLVADDQVAVTVSGGRLLAKPSGTLAGRIEVRGIGIVEMSHVPEAEVRLAVHLDRRHPIERLPDPMPVYTLLGLSIPLIHVSPFEASAPLKVLLALRHCQ